MEPFQSKIWGMIIVQIVAAFFIEIGQGCILSRTRILEVGRGCPFSSITSEKQWLKFKKGKGLRKHAAHTPAPLNFPGSLPGKQWIFLSLSKLECGPQELNSKDICLHLTLSTNWNKCDKVKKCEFTLKVTFSLPWLLLMLNWSLWNYRGVKGEKGGPMHISQTLKK